MPHVRRAAVLVLGFLLLWLAAAAVLSHFPRRWHAHVLYAGAAAVGAVLYLLLDRPAVRRLRRLELGQCRNCGYDLSGNVSGVCPECGNCK